MPADVGSQAMLEQMRMRVTWLAMAMVAVAIVHHVAMYVAGVAEVESALQEARKLDVVPEKWHAGASAVIARGFGKLLFFIAMSSAVPFCGYYGAKQHHAGLMGCFTCCNCLVTIGAIVAVCAGGIAWALLSSIAPDVEPWLHRCDPMRCLNLLSHNRTIDCLAGEGRTVIYEDSHHLMAACPQAFLDCAEPDGGALDPCVYPMGMARPGFEPADGAVCADQVRVQFCTDPMGRPGCRPSGWISSKCDEVGGYCVPVGLPTNPLAACDVNQEKVETYGKVAEVVPIIMPKLITLVALKLFLTLPAIVLGGLGVWWGWALLSKIREGYSTLPDARLHHGAAVLTPSAPPADTAAGGGL